MEEYSDNIMLALLPDESSWCRIELPHMTVVWAGKTHDKKPHDFNALVSDGLKIAQSFRPIRLNVTEIDVYGAGTAENPHVDVLKLEKTGELFILRRYVEQWNESEYAFSPHCTVGPQGIIQQQQIAIPKDIRFSRILIAWGNHHIVYPLSY